MMQPLPILLVEDNAIIQRITASDLERLDYSVVTAGTAAEALKLSNDNYNSLRATRSIDSF